MVTFVNECMLGGDGNGKQMKKMKNIKKKKTKKQKKLFNNKTKSKAKQPTKQK